MIHPLNLMFKKHTTTTTTTPSSIIIYPLPFKLINADARPGNTGAEVTGMPLGVLLLYW